MHSLRTTGLELLEALAREEWVPGFCTGFWPLSTYSLLWIAATEGMEGDPLLPMGAMNVPISLVHWDYASLSTQCKIMSARALCYKPYFSLFLLFFFKFLERSIWLVVCHSFNHSPHFTFKMKSSFLHFTNGNLFNMPSKVPPSLRQIFQRTGNSMQFLFKSQNRNVQIYATLIHIFQGLLFK